MFSLCSLVFAAAALSQQTSTLKLVPWPQSVVLQQGTLVLNSPKVVALDPGLESLAETLVQDIALTKGLRATRGSAVGPDCIVLKLDRSLADEAYQLEVDRDIVIKGKNLRAVSFGVSTLLQAIKAKGKSIVIPKVTIKDRPSRPYRGLMIDVARRYHSIDVLKQCVELCRLYKLNYLQLHLTDDQAFTFPSRTYPKLTGQNQHGGPAYTIEELKELMKFADMRGVTLIPEFDIPGHSAALNRTMPELFKIQGTKPYEHHATINFASPEVLAALKILIGEMCEVFGSSPYFHMGGDEADISFTDQHLDFQAAFRQEGLPEKSQHEIYRRFLLQINEIVKAKGKQLIVWEGFGRDLGSKFPIPKDVLVMEFENSYYLPTDLLADGYTVINASWTPLYVVNRHVWPAKKVYEWDISHFGRFSNDYTTTTWFQAQDTAKVLGSQICSWEGPEESEIENLRRIVPAMAERVWNQDLGDSYEKFSNRADSVNDLLDRMIHPVTIQHSNLDAVDPNGFDVLCFNKPTSISFKAKSGVIRYTLDGRPPTADSLEFHAPITVKTTTTVRAAPFSSAGKRIGCQSAKIFYYAPPKVPNLATGKPVTVSGGTQGDQVPQLAVDDNLSLASSWWAGPAPQWLQVDLGAVTPDVNRIEVFPYWDGSRYYQYIVEVSLDGREWVTVADRSSNLTPSSSAGDEIVFPPQPARFVRIHMLRCSANEAVHLVELRVWKKS